MSATLPSTAAPADAGLDGAPWTAEDEHAVRLGLLGGLLAQGRTSLLAHLAIGFTTLAVLLTSGRGWPVAAWCAALVVAVALRALHLRHLLGTWQTLDSAGTERAERELVVVMGACGAVWGVLPWLAYTGTDPFVDFFTIAMLVGMTAGAVNSAAGLPRALNVYLVLALAPFFVRGLQLGDVVSIGGAVTIFFSIIVLLGFGRSSHRAQRGALVAARENQRLARALQKDRDAVKAASRAKDLFLAGVTHDLRQPVHALALYLRHLRDLRADELSPPAVADLVAPMDLALRTMSVQLTRLLELSRLEAGEARVSRRVWSLQELFDALQAQFEPLARERGLVLQLRPLPCAVDSDPRLLQSIVDNLVSNALRCTVQGGVRVAARARRGGGVEIMVLDTGPGIARDQLPLLFTAYRRFDDRDRPQAETGEGLGLGLALVKKQAELLGHRLRVRSAVGRGTAFGLTVPRAAGVVQVGEPA